MKWLIFFLSLIDVLAGLTLYYGLTYISFYLASLMIIKGIYSLLTSISAGYYFDWMGLIDFITGILLYFNLFNVFGLITILKGLYSLILSLF